ncbi:MAG: DUF3240 family protein [Proteobacteria bacterium]|nr:DUF3240 family protein [Pseudomonadota bacterium]
MPECQILTLVVPVDVKDDVVDTLIEMEGITGFNLEKIAGFSKEHSRFNLREQVGGYRELYRFEVIHSKKQQPLLLSALRPVCDAPRIRYWITPILEQGHFGEAAQAPSAND